MTDSLTDESNRFWRLWDLLVVVSVLFCAVTAPQDAYAQNVVTIASGETHTLQLREDGTVWAWGDNTYGQLGVPDIASSSGAVQVSGLSGVVEIRAGAAHSLARTRDGQVWAWGDNYYQQLGDGTSTNRRSPTLLQGVSSVVEISAGGYRSLARTLDGRVWEWGNGKIPMQVPDLSAVVEISAGGFHSLARTEYGQVWAWGSNQYGQLGDGTTESQSSPVLALEASGVVEISAGGFHSLARARDGRVWAWGKNDKGQLGSGTYENWQSTPRRVLGLTEIAAIAAGWMHSLARTEDGRAFAWGYNGGGQLGDGGTGDRTTPVPVGGLTGVVEIAAGMWHSLARAQDGRVFAWGGNGAGQLGDGATANRSFPGVVQGVSRVVEVSAGGVHSLVRTQEGRVWAWGHNGSGQLGDGTWAGQRSPQLVPGLSGIVEISAGAGHSLVRTQEGRVWAWGNNYSGQLGDGTNYWAQRSPVLVPGVQGVVQISTRGEHSLALTQDGQVMAWGRNDYGALGDGTWTDKNSPVLVQGLSGVVEVSAGTWYSLARTQDGRVFAWGYNDAGRLGVGSTTFATNSPSPVLGVSGAVQISAGGNPLARSGDGRVWAWGRGAPSPVLVPGLPAVVDISAGGRASLARTEDGRVWTWGLGSSSAAQELGWFGGRASRISAGVDFNLVLTTGARAVAFGRNSYGMLGAPNAPGAELSSVPKLVADVMHPAVNRGGYPVVEFENKSIEGGRYFITVQTDEISALDSLSAAQGSSGGFTRSGRAWRGWRTQAEATAGATGASFASSIKPVYRFYVPGPNSHFYTVSESERDLLVNYNANLNPKVHNYEGAKFYAVQPNGSGATASCPSGTHPVYRAFNNKTASNQGNHRITSNWIDILRGVRFFGWTNEGIAFCSPNATIPGGDLQAYHTYPGDSVLSGSKMTAECVYNNAGPGTANGASLYCALPHQVNWTLKCSASQGAVCPAIGDNATNADGTLTPDNLRLGVDVASFPAGGIIHITATATAPDQSAELIFAGAIQQPGGAPDPNPTNNNNTTTPPTSKTVVKKASDCIVSLSSNNLALLHNDTATRQLSLKSPAGCAWTLSLESAASSMVSVSPTTGSGDSTLTLTGKANGSAQFRSGSLTATATTAASSSANRTAALLISQEAAPPVDSGCTTLTLTRENERQGPNIINASLGIRANTASCTWTMQSDQAWVVITQGANGKGSGNALYQIEANAGQSERKATLTIRGASGAPAQTLTIYQSSNATNLVNNGGAEGGGGDGGGDGGGGGGSGGEGGSAG